MWTSRVSSHSDNSQERDRARMRAQAIVSDVTDDGRHSLRIIEDQLRGYGSTWPSSIREAYEDAQHELRAFKGLTHA